MKMRFQDVVTPKNTNSISRWSDLNVRFTSGAKLALIKPFITGAAKASFFFVPTHLARRLNKWVTAACIIVSRRSRWLPRRLLLPELFQGDIIAFYFLTVYYFAFVFCTKESILFWRAVATHPSQLQSGWKEYKVVSFWWFQLPSPFCTCPHPYNGNILRRSFWKFCKRMKLKTFERLLWSVFSLLHFHLKNFHKL